MSHSLQQFSPTNNNHPPNHPSTEFPQYGTSSVTLNVTDSSSSLAFALPASSTTDRFLCTICVDSPDSPLDVAVLPACNHSFCLPCLASWSTVRQVCPNCKTSFATALLRRDLDSLPVQGPCTDVGLPPMMEHPVDAICQSSWIALHKIHSPKHDIEASFSLPPRELLAAFHAEDRNSPSASSPSVPHYGHEDFENELEDQFWEEEEYHHERLLRRTRTVSNRRYGPSGYISAGRMRAAPRPPQVQPGSSASHVSMCKSNEKAKMAGKSQLKSRNPSPNTSSSSTPKGNSNILPESLCGSDPSSGGRKKKMKKKSRAGLAAAKAAAEVAAAEKRRNKDSSCSNSVPQIKSALEKVAIGDTFASQGDVPSDHGEA